MIQVGYIGGFIIYIFIWLVTLTILWAREIWRQKAYDWARDKDKLCFCDECHHAFLTKHNENVTRCPRCNSMVFVRKRRSL